MGIENEWQPKLYVVTRSDLTPGARACQGMHAMREFMEKHPEIERAWYKTSNYIAFLEAPDEVYLSQLILCASSQNIAHACFCEPDFNDELTAVVFEPTLQSRDLLKELPSALKVAL